MKSIELKIPVNPKTLISFSTICLLAFTVFTFILSKSTGTNFNTFHFFIFNPTYSLILILLNIVSIFAGSLIILFIPGILIVYFFSKQIGSLKEYLALSAGCNILTHIVLLNFYKILSHNPVNRLIYLSLLLAITLILFIPISFIKLLRPQTLTFSVKTDKIKVGIILLVSIFCVFMLSNYLNGTPFDYQFDNVLEIPLGAQIDFYEAMGINESLKTHLYPYWDLEYAHKMGYHIIDPPLVYFFYFHLYLFWGESNVTVSIAFFIAVITFLILSLSGFHEKKIIPSHYYLALIPLFFSLIFFSRRMEHLFGISAYVLVIFIPLFIFYYFLNLKNYPISFLYACLSFCMAYEHLFFVSLGYFLYYFYFPNERQPILKNLKNWFIFIGIYILLLLLIGFLRNDLFTYIKAFTIEKFMRFDYFHIIKNLYPEQKALNWGKHSFQNIKLLVKNLMFYSSFTAIIIFLPKKDKFQKVLSGISIIYFLLLALSSYQQERYVMPLTIFTACCLPVYLFNLNRFFRERLIKK